MRIETKVARVLPAGTWIMRILSIPIWCIFSLRSGCALRCCHPLFYGFGLAAPPSLFILPPPTPAQLAFAARRHEVGTSLCCLSRCNWRCWRWRRSCPRLNATLISSKKRSNMYAGQASARSACFLVLPTRRATMLPDKMIVFRPGSGSLTVCTSLRDILSSTEHVLALLRSALPKKAPGELLSF